MLCLLRSRQSINESEFYGFFRENVDQLPNRSSVSIASKTFQHIFTHLLIRTAKKLSFPKDSLLLSHPKAKIFASDFPKGARREDSKNHCLSAARMMAGSRVAILVSEQSKLIVIVFKNGISWRQRLMNFWSHNGQAIMMGSDYCVPKILNSFIYFLKFQLDSPYNLSHAISCPQDLPPPKINATRFEPRPFVCWSAFDFPCLFHCIFNLYYSLYGQANYRSW